jgi:hypothetical protein
LEFAGYALLFFNLWKEELLQRNMDVVILTATGMVLNLAPFVFGLRPWFVWQAFVAYFTCFILATPSQLFQPWLTSGFTLPFVWHLQLLVFVEAKPSGLAYPFYVAFVSIFSPFFQLRKMLGVFCVS